MIIGRRGRGYAFAVCEVKDVEVLANQSHVMSFTSACGVSPSLAVSRALCDVALVFCR